MGQEGHLNECTGEWMDGRINEWVGERASDGWQFILSNLQAQGDYNSPKTFCLQTNNCCLATSTIEIKK